MLHIKNADVNNLKCISCSIPLNSLVTVAGVSGAGKSSLVHGVICDTLIDGQETNGKKWIRGNIEVESDIEITRVLLVDQKPIGKNSRSTPASYLKIWDEIRKLYAATIQARAQGWSSSFFSYNTGKGRCPECKGQGQIKLEMSFLAEAWIRCETCAGNRFNDQADSVKYLDISISDVLNLTFEEAKLKFANHRKIHQFLHNACELGLGYLTLGQSSASLSGGESQRIKLVTELAARKRGHTLYILDEPTTGLHKADVSRLHMVLRNLVDNGNSVIIIEHDADLLSQSEWILELGPGPGESGGEIIFEGPPQNLLTSDTPWGVLVRELTSCANAASIASSG